MVGSTFPVSADLAPSLARVPQPRILRRTSVPPIMLRTLFTGGVLFRHRPDDQHTG
jgi:hypothetical protein